MTTDTSREAVTDLRDRLLVAALVCAERNLDTLGARIEASRDMLAALLARAEAAEAERDAAYRRGAEAMREAVAKHICTMRDAWAAGYGQRAGVAYAEAIRAELRALPIPGETP